MFIAHFRLNVEHNTNNVMVESSHSPSPLSTLHSPDNKTHFNDNVSLARPARLDYNQLCMWKFSNKTFIAFNVAALPSWAELNSAVVVMFCGRMGEMFQ